MRQVGVLVVGAVLGMLVGGCSMLDTVASLLSPSEPGPDRRTLIYDTY